MPQPKSSSTARSAAAKKAAATRKKNANARSAAAKKGAARRKAATKKSAPAKAAAAAPDTARANATALRDALRRGVVVTTGSLREAMDDAVKRGQITRKDATALTTAIISTGRAQADGFRASIEQLLGKGTSRAAAQGDAVLRAGDRARRAVGVGPTFPISLYNELNASQIQKRLAELTPAELRKVRDFEKRHDARKSIISAIERRLKK